MISPPRGIAWVATKSKLSRSLTRFFGTNARVRFQVSLTLSSAMNPRATVSASPRLISAPAEPAAPKASRQNCSLAVACPALFLIRARAKSRVSSSFDSSSTSRPLTMAPVGLIRSWQTREHSSAARSRPVSVVVIQKFLQGIDRLATPRRLPGVLIPKFEADAGASHGELWNHRDTSKFMIPGWFWISHVTWPAATAATSPHYAQYHHFAAENRINVDRRLHPPRGGHSCQAKIPRVSWGAATSG